jgi:hypothetical protein
MPLYILGLVMGLIPLMQLQFSAWLGPGPYIGALTIWIAYQQYELQRRKVRMDLYDRRLAVYTATMEWLAKCLNNQAGSPAEVFEWRRHVREADFLFGHDVQDQLEEIYRYSTQFIQASVIAKNAPDVAGNVSDHTRLMAEAFPRMQATKTVFERYLKIE